MGKLHGLAQPMGELDGLAERELPRICRRLGAAGPPPERAYTDAHHLPLSPAQRSSPERASSSLPLPMSSPAQQELLQKEPPQTTFLYRAAPRSGTSLRRIPERPPPSLYRAAPRSGTSLRRIPERPPPSLYRAAPRSGSPPRKSILPPSNGQPREAGAPLERV